MVGSIVLSNGSGSLYSSACYLVLLLCFYFVYVLFNVFMIFIHGCRSVFRAPFSLRFFFRDYYKARVVMNVTVLQIIDCYNSVIRFGLYVG